MNWRSNTANFQYTGRDNMHCDSEFPIHWRRIAGHFHGARYVSASGPQQTAEHILEPSQEGHNRRPNTRLDAAASARYFSRKRHNRRPQAPSNTSTKRR